MQNANIAVGITAKTEATCAWPRAEREVSLSWWRHWELWLALTLGGLLRLWHADYTTFGDDQAALMTMARQALERHELPVTGIPSSIGSLSPPLSIYALIPFAAGGTNPLPAVLSLAVWNVFGVAVCYVLARRFFGRRIATVGTLLFATCGAAVGYSRFIWQQNYLPPVIALWAMTLFAGSVAGKRWWLAPNVTLLVLAALLHPTALLLAPVTLAGTLLAPERPRMRDYTLAAALLAILLAPTIVWETISQGSDFTILLRYARGPSVVDPNVVFRLYQVLGGPLMAGSVPRPGHGLGALASLVVRTPMASDFLPGAPYGALGGLPLVVALLAFAIFVVGWLTLTLRVFAPAVERWRAASAGAAGEPSASVWHVRIGAVWQGLRADPQWRAFLLLWLSVSLPVALMLRHAGGIYAHYLIILYPLVFLVSALPVSLWSNREWMVIDGNRKAPVLRSDWSSWSSRAVALLPQAVVLVLSMLIIGQTVQTGAFVASLASGAVNSAPKGYGFPLTEIQSADERIAGLQSQFRASQTVLINDAAMDTRLTYLLVGSHSDRVASDDHCLVLPDASTTPSLVVVTSSESPAGQLLTSLPNARAAGGIPMPGGAAFVSYSVSGAVPLLADETAVAPSIFERSVGGEIALRLDALSASPATRTLRLRWTVLSPGSVRPVPDTVRFSTRPLTTSGGFGPSAGYHDCQPTAWHARDTVFTWIPLPTGDPAQRVVVQAQNFKSTLTTAEAGPVTLLAGSYTRTPLMTLPAMSSPTAEGSPGIQGIGRPQGLELSMSDLMGR